jgi:hypothetical protein
MKMEVAETFETFVPIYKALQKKAVLSKFPPLGTVLK